MYEYDLALNKPQELIYHKILPIQTKPSQSNTVNLNAGLFVTQYQVNEIRHFVFFSECVYTQVFQTFRKYNYHVKLSAGKILNLLYMLASVPVCNGNKLSLDVWDSNISFE